MPNKKAIFIALTIFIAINLYTFFHINFFLNDDISSYVTAIVYIFLMGSFVLPMLPLAKTLIFLKSRFIKVVGSVFIGVFAFLLQAFLVFDIVCILVNVFGEATPDFYKISGTIIFLTVLVLSVLSIRNASETVVRKFSIEVDKRNEEVDSLRFLLVSDVHLGSLIGNKRLAKLVTLINEQNPDAVLFAGDILDGDFEPFKKENMDEQFTKIKPEIATFGALGNHEYYGKRALEFAEAMNNAGVKMLLDETANFRGVEIVGRHDVAARSYLKPRMTMDEVVGNVKGSKTIIVIDHKPDDYDNASAAGVDVIVSGHTHRGQIAPGNLVTGRMFKNDWGYKKLGDLHTFVTAGYGTWGPPMRLGSSSEVFEIELKFRK